MFSFFSCQQLAIQFVQHLQSHQSSVEGPSLQGGWTTSFQFPRQHPSLTNRFIWYIVQRFIVHLPLGRKHFKKKSEKKMHLFCFIFATCGWVWEMEGGGMREGEKRWVACETHKDNGVVLKTDCPNSQDASVGASCSGEVHVEPERSPLTF